MAGRTTIPPELIAEVLITSRRRCCICFALNNDDREKKGQIAHLDQDASNSSPENLLFLCLDHHDQYDSRTSQSKGFTLEEVRRYRSQLASHVARTLPLSNNDIARALLAGLDRPAFRTPFHQESSLPRFRAAITETIAAINTGKTPSGTQLPCKTDILDGEFRTTLDAIVERLVALRATFDEMLRTGDIRPCGCQDPDCPVYMLSNRAAREMDRRRHELLAQAQKIDPTFPARFYDIA